MAYPFEFSTVVPVLKKILKDRKLTYKALARKLHMSEANVKKIMTAKDCSLKRLNQICEALDFSVFDLIEMLRKKPVRRVLLNSAQQRVLTEDETSLLLYFKIAFEQATTEHARRDLNLTEVNLEKKMRQLERVGLIKRHKLRIQIPEEHIGVWPDEGVLASLVKTEWTKSLLNAALSGRGTKWADLGLRYFRLSQKSTQEFRTLLSELMNDFERVSMLEEKITPNLNDVSCLFAVVPDSLTKLRQQTRRGLEPF